MRETTAELVEEIACAVGKVEPRLGSAAIRSAIEATTQSDQELRMLLERYGTTTPFSPGRQVANASPTSNRW
jgi:hypothetical protein